MPTYKGNVGHLMQHWTLCELLNIAQRQGAPGLNFIDAHAMAPLARTKEHWDDEQFNRVEAQVQRDHGPGHVWASKYEWAWHHLTPSIGYPNSAVFVEKVWRGSFALSLCEVDPTTIEELESWQDRVGRLARCQNAKICRGDWRGSFARALRTLDEVNLPDGSLTLVSFDPYLISRHPRPNQRDDRQSGTVYPQDLREVRNQLSGFDGKVIIYLPTYSAQNNPQPEVLRKVDEKLTQDPNGFRREAQVRVDGNMMSLIYTRGFDPSGDWSRRLRRLPYDFTRWFNQATAPDPPPA